MKNTIIKKVELRNIVWNYKSKADKKSSALPTALDLSVDVVYSEMLMLNVKLELEKIFGLGIKEMDCDFLYEL